MFLVMLLIECLKDRRTYVADFYEPNARHVNPDKIFGAAGAMLAEDYPAPAELKTLLRNILGKIGTL